MNILPRWRKITKSIDEYIQEFLRRKTKSYECGLSLSGSRPDTFGLSPIVQLKRREVDIPFKTLVYLRQVEPFC